MTNVPLVRGQTPSTGYIKFVTKYLNIEFICSCLFSLPLFKILLSLTTGYAQGYCNQLNYLGYA